MCDILCVMCFLHLCRLCQGHTGDAVVIGLWCRPVPAVVLRMLFFYFWSSACRGNCGQIEASNLIYIMSSLETRLASIWKFAFLFFPNNYRDSSRYLVRPFLTCNSLANSLFFDRSFVVVCVFKSLTFLFLFCCCHTFGIPLHLAIGEYLLENSSRGLSDVHFGTEATISMPMRSCFQRIFARKK